MKTINKISCFEYGILVYFLIRSTSLGMGISSYIHIGRVDGYLSPLIGMIIGFIPLFIYLKILDYKPDLTIYEKIDYLFGKKIGHLVNIILMLGIAFLVTVIFWNLLNFIGSQYLFRTSNIYISIMFGITIFYLVSKNLNVTIRVANMLFYFSLIIFFICTSGLINQIKIINLLPFLENGINNVLLSALSHVAYVVLPLFILLLIPKDNIKNNKKLHKTILLFYIIANIGKFIVIFLTISIFGIDLATLYEFPDFVLLRRISTTGFFQRYESILATQWLFDLFIMICMCFNYIKYGYKHLINNKFYNLFIGITILFVCIFSSSYLFINNTIGEHFIIFKFPFIIYGFLFIIPFIIYLKIKKT